MRRRRVVLPLVVIAGALLVVIGARWYQTQTDWQWTDVGVHAVDGYYVTAEHPCPQDGSDVFCAAGIEAAVRSDASLKVFTAATAGLPSRWVDGDGVPYRSIRSGPVGMGPTMLLLTLLTGERRSFPLYCTWSSTAWPPSDVSCRPWDGAGQYRVGTFLPDHGLKDEQRTSAY